MDVETAGWPPVGHAGRWLGHRRAPAGLRSAADRGRGPRRCLLRARTRSPGIRAGKPACSAARPGSSVPTTPVSAWSIRITGGCCDGLHRTGRNENQGAESTLAMISTFQRCQLSRDAMTTDLLRRVSLVLRADPSRVIAKLFLPGQETLANGISRADQVIHRVLAMKADQVTRTLTDTVHRFGDRHADLPGILRSHFELVAHRLPAGSEISDDRAALIGAYFTQEYSIEAAALFNPSMVAHPDQSGLGPRRAAVRDERARRRRGTCLEHRVPHGRSDRRRGRPARW